jgi:plastocyanin
VAEVAIVEYAFEPAELIVTRGTTVRWTNRGILVHTTTSADGGWDSGPMLDGQTFTVTFSTPGTYAYFCANHPLFMAGTITVVDGP